MLEVAKWYACLNITSWTFGIGWWKGSSKVFTFTFYYYDGNYFGGRLGPLFICRGPY